MNDAQSNADPFHVGQVVDNKFRIVRIIGRGGVGVVAEADHVMLRHRVALKALRPELMRDPVHIKRFVREARASVRLQSEHVARVNDVGTLPSGVPYLVMEYLQGCTLKELLRAQGPLSPTEAVRLILEACDAIAEAHALGIVHRDIKPANLFLAVERDGSRRLRVLDFGIAKAAPAIAGSAGGITAGGGLGSPRYMSPEQIVSSKDVDVTSDIYSLGVTLYELVAGTTPFGSSSRNELRTHVLHVNPPALSERVPNLPYGFSAVVMRCLLKDARGRYGSVQELARALVPYGPEGSREKIEQLLRLAPPPSSDLLQWARRSQPPETIRTLTTDEPPEGYGSDRTGAAAVPRQRIDPHARPAKAPTTPIHSARSSNARLYWLLAAGVLLLFFVLAGLGLALWLASP